VAELLGYIQVRQTMAALRCLHHISKQWRRKLACLHLCSEFRLRISSQGV